MRVGDGEGGQGNYVAAFKYANTQIRGYRSKKESLVRKYMTF